MSKRMEFLIIHWFQLCFLIGITWISGAGSQAFIRLGKMHINKDFISVSGFSSGGTMAQHMFVSYSSIFSGLAVFSHTYYRCGPGNGIVEDFDDVCTTTTNRRTNELYDPNNALIDIKNYFSSGLIDNPRNMENKPLYVFAGTSNFLFTTDMSLRILKVLGRFINNPAAIRTKVVDANLTLPSNNRGLPLCNGPQNEQLVSYCGFSGALDALRFLLGKVAIRTPPYGNVKLQQLLTFDQTEFFRGVGRNDMDNVGYMYIPKMCKISGVECLLHFFFHGCMAGREFVGSSHILNSGYLEVAETNGIIMIFPQAVSSPDNEIGCWDTYGFTGSLYATQRGGQVRVIRNMVDRILGRDLITSNVPTLRPVFHGTNIDESTEYPLGLENDESSASYEDAFHKRFTNSEPINCMDSSRFHPGETFFQKCFSH